VRREICIDSIPGETRVALVEEGLLTEILVERAEARGTAGNIYLGRVRNILPGMQAAFVDLGLERDGFLYVEDAGSAPRPRGGEAEAPGGAEAAAAPPPPPSRIEDLVREGQEVVVQVAKDPMAQKGPRITTHITLPGRLLVFAPGVEHVGVSRRIEDAGERERLRSAVQDVLIRIGGGGGFIVRTAAAGLESADFEPDARALVATWDAVARRRARANAPALLHQEAGAVERALRDLMRDGVGEVAVDSDELVREAEEVLGRAALPVNPRVVRHEGSLPLFEARGLQIQLERALRPRVWLKSGGHIVLNQTEALVAIDVNTGKYVGREGLEETILRTNLEAVREIVRQIRLRDLGGIIVIDFIDMQDAGNRTQVISAMEQEIRNDRARSRMLQISDFGLVEITRQRTRPSLERMLCTPCRACGGAGLVLSVETIRLDLIREGRKRRPLLGDGTLVARVHPDVAPALAARTAELAAAMGGLEPGRIIVAADPDLRPDQWALQTMLPG
jgi:ribonuclease G